MRQSNDSLGGLLVLGALAWMFSLFAQSCQNRTYDAAEVVHASTSQESANYESEAGGDETAQQTDGTEPSDPDSVNQSPIVSSSAGGDGASPLLPTADRFRVPWDSPESLSLSRHITVPPPLLDYSVIPTDTIVARLNTESQQGTLSEHRIRPPQLQLVYIRSYTPPPAEEEKPTRYFDYTYDARKHNWWERPSDRWGTLQPSYPTYPYTRPSEGHWVQQVRDMGRYVILQDGAIYEVEIGGQSRTATWLPTDQITIDPSGDSFSYRLINKSRGESVLANPTLP